MLKAPYMEKFYSYNSKYIHNALALRDPQHDSLEIFARLCDVLSLRKNPMTTEQICADHAAELDACPTNDKRQALIEKLASTAAKEFYREDLAAVRQLCPTLTSFERDFPSVCFALATGIGKTRLMGACIAYLHYEKGISNFFVMAPNLTIYNKLKDDLSNTSSPKYVFRGLDRFVTPPRIIDGDNYENFRMTRDQLSWTESNEVIINVFNISKLNSDSKVKDGKPARIKRLNEVLGESYFEYLQSLPDLCIFMDESHHYHADKSFSVINELRPILGVELTATPQIQKGAKKIDFKNVVYEYSLAHALNEERYVKVPAVITRKISIRRNTLRSSSTGKSSMMASEFTKKLRVSLKFMLVLMERKSLSLLLWWSLVIPNTLVKSENILPRMSSSGDTIRTRSWKSTLPSVVQKRMKILKSCCPWKIPTTALKSSFM